MSKTPAILDARGNPIRTQATPPARMQIRARYDAAIHSEETARHWALADGMSARAANSPALRRILRDRARQEVANNSYAYGMIDTLANDTIGTGPRIQLLGDDPDENRTVEQAFMCWSKAVGLAAKLRTMRKSRAVDGEGFGLLTSNPRLMLPVQLDLKLIEADQVATPWLNPVDPLAVDGIRYDTHGNPVEYSLLQHHPGDTYQTGYQAYAVDARQMIHWFKAERPGQCRGVPEITPALPLFAQLRRYTLSVAAASETAADFAAVLESEMSPDTSEGESVPFETLEIERRMMMTLPAGSKLNQFKAQQPVNTYEMFKHEVLNEIARCLNMPFNIAAGNSSSYNYASGRLDHQTYYKSLGIEQTSTELVILDYLFSAWLEEANLVNLVNGGPQRLQGWPHQWFWDGHEHIDPLKEANAQSVRLANHATTLADEYAKRGQDWEVQLRQRAKEMALMAELGLTVYLPAGQLAPPDSATVNVPYIPEDDDAAPDAGDDN